MLVSFSWVSNMGYEKETETGYDKAVRVAGFPGLEKWNTESKDGELTLVANKRYIVELEGDDIDDPKVLNSLAESMSLGKLPAQYFFLAGRRDARHAGGAYRCARPKDSHIQFETCPSARLHRILSQESASRSSRLRQRTSTMRPWGRIRPVPWHT
jgi:hypothetical protein